MNVLVLNRYSLANTPYQAWLGEPGPIVVVTDDTVTAGADLSRYAEVVPIADYEHNPMVELTALRLHQRHRFDSVVAMSEADVLRAARLREAMGIGGQDVRSAEAFRDKLVMKQILAAAGIPVAAFAAAPDATAIYRFLRDHPYPIVVKPRRGHGSMGVEVIRDDDALDRFLATERSLWTDDGAPLLVESYVPHEHYHVDGLVVDGVTRLIWPSAMSSCLAHLDGVAMRSVQLAADDPLRAPLADLTERVLSVLPTPETTIFHAEVFRTPDGELVFNEIASRIGGGKIHAATKLAFGLDLGAAYIGALTGGPAPAPPAEPDQAVGWVLFPPVEGVLLDAPERCPVPGVVDYRLHAKPGTRMGRSSYSTEAIATAVLTGPDQATVQDTIDSTVTWFHDEMKLG
ncbi:ATP-grasp domain-containing protein [Micromonospora sp. WMMD1120]|uniref:ATP-grasp domain-containing protein n=1 Tax=Micromonospora sp. WMMD1120 TaxID=3016106 RepID=UPI0024163993|nr:ATP-grasp domain-containing protein [Micromonospora sp. WMMD1120]MDG4807553.1 ATP-grasp domain-containing protein [Micromonospora sp. WMMD1120]